MLSSILIIFRNLIKGKSKLESSERKWADLDEPHIETTSVFPEVCYFQEVASWSQNQLSACLSLQTHSNEILGEVSGATLTENLSLTVSYLLKSVHLNDYNSDSI